MTKLYVLLLTFFTFSLTQAQVIKFSDVNFKNRLLRSESDNNTAKNLDGVFFKIDANNDGEIQVEEAAQVSFLDLVNYGISNLDGIENFVNVQYLGCFYNTISEVNLDKLAKLDSLDLSVNRIKSLDISTLKKLRYVNLHQNEVENLNVSGLSNLNYLDSGRNQLTSLDVSSCQNLKTLICSESKLSELNVRNLSKLLRFECYTNNLTALYLDDLSSLTYFRCEENKLKELNVKNLTELTYVQCFNNQLETLDFSNSKKLDTFYCFNNLLTSLFVKTGSPLTKFEFYYNPTLKYICVDDNKLAFTKNMVNQLGYVDCEVNTYCSFDPGKDFYVIKGSHKLDLNNDGCDLNDKPFQNINFKITDGITSGNIFSDISNDFKITVAPGQYTITPVLENPDYFSVSPESFAVTFPAEMSPFTQNFCIVPKGNHQDVEVSILSILPARPGFDASYKIVFKNKANITVSGSVTFDFNDAVLDYVSSIPIVTNQLSNKLIWEYVDLKPYEVREIAVTLNVNSPMETPAVNINDRLSFNALITPVTGDEKPVDNSFAMRQTVVGSYDPNDKTCLEGDIITPELIGEYVHYLIRFENTGTYPAENIVVKDLIDLSKFDISTLVPTISSHSYTTKISEGNKVEFIFEKINLPFDDAHNDGYIAFKIKTLPTLKVGDSFTNEANIYFDYNFPILTNKATSTFKTLGTEDFEFSKYFNVYPNPVKDILNISLQNNIVVISISIYDILGQLVVAIPNIQNISNIDVSKLRSGNYILKVKSDKGSSNTKFIKL
ncbi:hypothetical protein J2Y38_003766 [Flavobacterium sp. 2755]|uniref:T9SS type A sorting domain-containing protein n=1 Tax=Flavobacterium sp. 2755 TaxID=2817765 RepID=UPI0028642EAD|nr:T9SS type A sorting domain-containing protein [Flavobacterium sp. 2755]MDR6763545.1 hypothetical protein [Flavobacterium sp. 2755]